MAEKVGAVMVIGGGIAGIQSSLDLAESGYYVYMVETSPAIGGVMAQLDKTFPTNDCSMCVISPKLVEAGCNLNINILTATDVEGISGEPGNFSVRVRKRARFVDLQKCTACGDCATVCPISRPNEFNALINSRKVVYKRYPQAIPNAYAIEKRGEAPCRNACPIEQRAMGYVALIREKRYADAYRTIKEDNPFPSVCGRVCQPQVRAGLHPRRQRPRSRQHHAFEALRNRLGVRAPGRDPESLCLRRPAQAGHQRIGQEGGHHRRRPAGLTAASDLINKNYQVTVFEALPAAGGMMRVGIPEYRMPYDLVQKEVDEIVSRGLELKLNSRVDDAAGLLGEYNAVFVATGAHVGLKTGIPGNDLPDVHVATDFLRAVSLRGMDGNPTDLKGKRVLVLGGGNVAVPDSAMSSVRLGAMGGHDLSRRRRQDARPRLGSARLPR